MKVNHLQLSDYKAGNPSLPPRLMRLQDNTKQIRPQSSRIHILNMRVEAGFYGDNFATITSKGGRVNNEDTAGYLRVSRTRQVWVIADGLGGHIEGEIASKMAVWEYLKARAAGNEMEKSVNIAHQIMGAIDYPGEKIFPGTTLTILEIDEEQEMVYILHTGDSRCKYIEPGMFGESMLLTTDSTQGFEAYYGVYNSYPRRDQELDCYSRDSNYLNLRNRLPAYLGKGMPLKLEIISIPITKGTFWNQSFLVLYSDGLTSSDGLRESDLTRVVCDRKKRHPLETVERLYLEAYQYGYSGRDNTSVVLVALPRLLDMKKKSVHVVEYKKIA